jgi:lysophospholipase L1-like esterase
MTQPDQPTTRQPSILKTTLIIVFITALMLLFAEGIARAILWRSSAITDKVDVAFGYSTGGYGDLLPNIESVERLYPTRPYYLKTNSVGLRNIEELNDDPNVLRILAIGDSFTYGFYVHNQEAFPSRLQEVLNERLAPRRVQVLNAGIPGYTIADELSYLKDKGLALNPDIVIVGFYTNDVFDLTPDMRQYFAREVVLAQASPAANAPAGLQTWLRDNVALYSLWRNIRYGYVEWQVEQQVANITPTLPDMHRLYEDITFLKPEEHQDLWQEYEATFKEMAALLKERNIPLVLVAFPDLSEMPLERNMPDVPQQFLTRLTAETDTPFVNMLPVLREAGDIATVYLMYYNPDNTGDPNSPGAGAMMYSGDGHLSVYGNLVTARTIAETLVDAGLIEAE